MLKAMHNFKKRNKKGFTLIELLIVVAIIAILAAIAIPQFSQYRKRGYNAAANSDLRNMRTTEEAMYADFTEYGQGANTAGGGQFQLSGTTTNTTAQTVTVSPKVIAVADGNGAGGASHSAYNACTIHEAGDQYYGVGSFQTAVYRMTAPASITVAQAATDCPDSGNVANEFSAWTQIQ